MNKNTTLLIYLLFLFTSNVLCSHHDEFDFILERVSLDDDTPKGRLLSVSNRQNIRIQAFFELDNANNFIATKIQQQLIPAAISYFQTTLKVDQLSSNIVVSQATAKQCGMSSPPAALSGAGISADLVLFVTGKSDPDSTATASSRPCVLMDKTNRPILGVINYNFGSAWEGTSESAYEGDLLTTLHEITHILGFTPSLFNDYINPSTGALLSNTVMTKMVNGINTTVLTVAPLTARVRNYFGCSTVEGAYLENQGDSGSRGSHFERRIFFNELMTASESQDGRLSEFTLALLEGTGWYTPDYSMADPLFWGKGEGCDFLNQTCYNSATSQARFSEFCTTRQSSGCTFTGTAKAVCGTNNDYTSDNLLPQFDYFGDKSVMLDPFCDNCPYFYGISNLGCTNPANTIKQISEEVYGDGSMCFMGNLGKKAALSNNVAYCFQQTCTQVLPGLYTVQLQIGNTTVNCPSGSTTTIPGYQGTIQCPDSYTFCTTKALQYCKRGCLGRGECVDGVCVCNEGYSGESCLMRTDLSEPSDNTFLHPLAIYIGLGIMAVVIIVGVIVNRCQKRRERAQEKAGYLSVHGVTGQPMRLGKAYQSPSKSQNQSQGRQGVTTNTEMLRQQALEKNAPNKTKGTDALAAIRGVRNKM